jgi:uncharacterized protein YbbC (DUF1343 family)
MFHKHAGRTCEGVQVHGTDPGHFSPVRAYLALLREARRHEGFRWRTEPYEFVADRPAIDLLLGDPAMREALDAGATVDEVLAHGRERLAAWDAEAPARWLYHQTG